MEWVLILHLYSNGFSMPQIKEIAGFKTEALCLVAKDTFKKYEERTDHVTVIGCIQKSS